MATCENKARLCRMSRRFLTSGDQRLHSQSARHKFGSGTLLKPRERDLLLRADETDLVHNIQKALQSLSEQPSLLDDPYVDETLFRIVHESARP